MKRLTVHGVIPSLKNQKRIGKGRIYDDPEVKAFKNDFYLFVPASKDLVCPEVAARWLK